MNLGRALIGGLVLAGLQACSSLGPSTLSQGRPAYNEAIAASNAEQYLSWIVRSRYGLPTSQLVVASITANVRFSSTANVNVGIGPDDSFAGNLVPLSGGVTYDENPTISYLPLQGEQHMRTLLSPVPVDILALLMNVSNLPGNILAVVVKRINGISNLDFLSEPDQEADSRFAELMTIVTRLDRADKRAIFESGEEGKKSYSLWIHDYLPDYGEDVRRFLELLDIEGVEVGGDDIILPIFNALRRPTNKSIAVQTRSVVDIGRIASASVDVPEADQARGLALNFPETGLAGDFIHVRRAAERPPNAAAATRFQDWWYYIAGDDATSKQYFWLFEALMSVQLTASAEESRAPVLTVPVSR